MNDDNLTTVSGSDSDVNSGDTVSSGDSVIVCDSGDTVSSGDSVIVGDSGDTVSEVIVPEGYYDSVVGGLCTITYLLSALLFFTIFKWVEIKVRAVVRKVMWHE